MKALLAFAIGLVMVASATIVTGVDLVQCDFDHEDFAIDLNTGEIWPIFWEEPDELYSQDMIFLNLEDMPPLQLPSNPSWTFDDMLSLPGCPDMFIDMDNIFSDIDTSPEWWVPDPDLDLRPVVEWMPGL